MLKLICKAVAGFALFGAAAILAAQTIPHFDYIVIIFQENRTPDNLFGVTPAVSCNQEDPFELGVDIVDGGCRQGSGNNGSCPANDVPICNIPLPLDTNAVLDNNRHSVDPPHSHKSTWVPDYDNGNMDGFIQEQGKDQKGNPIFYQYSYVNKSDVQAYYDISTAYGFANYMFQTNQGPSFEAHQFIFGGTSAPLDITVNQMCNSTPCYEWFAAELEPGNTQSYGCSAPYDSNNVLLKDIGPDNTEAYSYQPDYSGNQAPYAGYPCYDHQTLANLLPKPSNGGPAWKYYAPSEQDIWDAPSAVYRICGDMGNGPCPNFKGPDGEYYKNMMFESTNNLAPIFDDIDTCKLAPVSWVVPDVRWSDHPGCTSPGSSCNNPNNPNGSLGLGPYYVADIVNAIGQSKCTDSNNNNTPLWQNVAIFITWDDWGGWYDHVPPFSASGAGTNGWGKYYTYGFRVPLLVVSAYTKPGTVSGACGTGEPNACPYFGQIGQTANYQYVHDFGSILAFTENNFNIPIGTIGPMQYPFADYYAPDSYTTNNGTNIPLQEFFNLSSPSTFTPIAVPITYDEDFFENYQGSPEDGED
jgi:phospholipase C